MLGRSPDHYCVCVFDRFSGFCQVSQWETERLEHKWGSNAPDG